MDTKKSQFFFKFSWNFSNLFLLIFFKLKIHEKSNQSWWLLWNIRGHSTKLQISKNSTKIMIGTGLVDSESWNLVFGSETRSWDMFAGDWFSAPLPPPVIELFLLEMWRLLQVYEMNVFFESYNLTKISNYIKGGGRKYLLP